MKKIFYSLIFFLCFSAFLLLGTSPSFATAPLSYYDWGPTLEVNQSDVLGQVDPVKDASSGSSKTTPASQYLQFNRYLFGKGLTPSNIFYFVKPLQENVQLILTFDQKTKSRLRLQIAGERLDEMRRLASSDNIRAIASSSNAYRKTMTALSSRFTSMEKQNVKADGLLEQLEEETAKHNVVLERIRIQAPDQAEDVIDGALQISWKSTDLVADLKGRPAIPPDLVSRLKSLELQGLLSSEEVSKLIGVKSRVEAREEIRKYLNEGVVSESDFLRLNETAKSFYPDDFYQVHETLRFQEMQKLENQKPDDATLNKIQSFAKIYKPGDQVPVELRKYWVPVMRLEEIQNTLRPDLIDANLFRQNDQSFKKFNEVVERFKPRPEDIAFVKNFIQKNNVEINNLPPEYQRMYNLAQRYGAQCGAGFNWMQDPQNPAGGYCVPKGADAAGFQKYESFTKDKSCSGNLVSAKSTNGACSAFPLDCIPPGWSKTDTCVATPGATSPNKINCPSNAHFVPVPYDPNGGYCIPNYTQVDYSPASGMSEAACPQYYHRSYAGGPCVPDYNPSTFNNPYSLPRMTTTPGGSYYTDSGQCGPNSNWVPEPVNPRGGYCTPTQTSANAPVTNMGNCRTPGECYDFCKNNPTTPSCSGFNPSQPRPGDTFTPSRESQEAACRAGGGTCVSWVNGACGCERMNSGGAPPAGYGSCPSGQYWNGSGCQQNPSYSPPPQTESPEEACRRGGGCTWTGSSCNCSSSSSAPPPSSPPPEQPPPQSDPAGTCSQTPGCTWNGSACQCNPQ